MYYFNLQYGKSSLNITDDNYAIYLHIIALYVFVNLEHKKVINKFVLQYVYKPTRCTKFL